jgi:hypothetical protein
MAWEPGNESERDRLAPGPGRPGLGPSGRRRGLRGEATEERYHALHVLPHQRMEVDVNDGVEAGLTPSSATSSSPEAGIATGFRARPCPGAGHSAETGCLVRSRLTACPR